MATKKQQISKIMSDLARLSHKKSPRTREYFSRIQKKRWADKRKLELSTAKEKKVD